MVFIISKHGEPATISIMKWLKRMNEKVVRLNFGDFTRGRKVSLRLSSGETNVMIDEIAYSEEEIRASSVWLRKLEVFQNHPDAWSLKQSLPQSYQFSKPEYNTYCKSLEYLLKDARWLSHADIEHLNKIDVLNHARICGLKIPDTIITNNKEELTAFLTGHPKAITKCLTDGSNIGFKEKENGKLHIFQLTTNLLTKENLEDIPDFFVPSIVQAYQEKTFELRIFYLAGQFYAIAIFSQKQKGTMIDFRVMDDREAPSRMTAFELPDDIKEKLHLLMQSIRLNTGSIDMIYTHSGEYVFLEVNPTGQYGWLDTTGNYHIDKQIALFLKNN